MSHKRSGLLPGLAIGLIAALICAAGLGAAVLFQTRLPYAVTAFGSGHPLSVALSLLIALLVTLAIGAVRPRSVTLIPVGALYAGGAVAAGQIAGSSIMTGAAMHGKDAPADLSDITLTNASDGLSHALSLYGGPLTETWPVWLYIAVAALSALLLLTVRVSRIRRAQRAEPAEDQEQQEEPEYRAPFEPAQAPAKQPAADLFTPRNPARD
ncbi:hypothetical protein ETD86_31525 [Nonomuraea turkmeniaca]|uniref:Uncharacterized protein n=1 Tax=Nonomuraea turkmeniaca TaxID=103838 RepID=A0A5S4F8H1_9ACTN|nr:hypothetical protein [Nonomuraea turkmeniaca]TMR12975.1 hypothetical protein ETD86_31525 [Nonomuraea turkmeniaca]